MTTLSISMYNRLLCIRLLVKIQILISNSLMRIQIFSNSDSWQRSMNNHTGLRHTLVLIIHMNELSPISLQVLALKILFLSLKSQWHALKQSCPIGCVHYCALLCRTYYSRRDSSRMTWMSSSCIPKPTSWQPCHKLDMVTVINLTTCNHFWKPCQFYDMFPK